MDNDDLTLEEIISKEADASEFRAVLYEVTGAEVTEGAIADIIVNYPKAIALVLKGSEPLPDGSRRCELWNGLIIHLDKRDAAVGHGVAEGVEIPEHYTVRVKFHKKFLDTLSNEFGLEVKNG